YFRIRRGESELSLIAMDAPPDKESCGPFVRVAHLLAEAGAHVPKIHAQDLEQGFLLLSDLGDTTYLDALDEHNAGKLYEDALDALLKIQRASRPGLLPDYSRELLEKELRLFPVWYVARQLRRELDASQLQTLEKAFSTILDNNLAQARVFVHRDYHSRNLMVCEPCRKNHGFHCSKIRAYGQRAFPLARAPQAGARARQARDNARTCAAGSSSRAA